MKAIPIITTIVTAVALGMSALAQDKAPEIKKPVANAEALDAHFSAAKTNFKKDNDKAADEIGKAAGLLSKQAASASTPANGKPLVTQSMALKSLAADVKAGTVKKEGSLDTAFAQAHQVLATYFQGRAERSLAEKAKDQAATSMNATANHIEAAAKWSGQTLGDAGKQTISLLRKTSGTLVGGAGSVVETSGDILKSGLGLITKLGTTIKGEKKEEGNIAEKTVDATKKGAGSAVETTGKVTEGGADIVKKGGGKIKEIGDKLKGDKKEE